MGNMRHSLAEMITDILAAVTDPTPAEQGRLPDHYRCIGALMTNCDHSIDEQRADRLRREEHTWANYHAWEFQGHVWYDREAAQFCCDILRYRKFQECVRRPTLRAIMAYCCDKWGRD